MAGYTLIDELIGCSTKLPVNTRFNVTDIMEYCSILSPSADYTARFMNRKYNFRDVTRMIKPHVS